MATRKLHFIVTEVELGNIRMQYPHAYEILASVRHVVQDISVYITAALPHTYVPVHLMLYSTTSA